MVDSRTSFVAACGLAGALLAGCAAPVAQRTSEENGYRTNVPAGTAPDPVNAAGRTMQGSEVAADNPCTKIGIVVYPDSQMLRRQFGMANAPRYNTVWGPGYVSTAGQYSNNLVVPVTTINGINQLAVFDNSKSSIGRIAGTIILGGVGHLFGGGLGKDILTGAGALGGYEIGSGYDKGKNAAQAAENETCLKWIKAGGADYVVPVAPPRGGVLAPGAQGYYQQQQDPARRPEPRRYTPY